MLHPILRAAMAPLMPPGIERTQALAAIQPATRPLKAFKVKLILADGERHTLLSMAPNAFTALSDAMLTFPNAAAAFVRPFRAEVSQ